MRTYGALGPRGEPQDPSFLRSIALMALARRRGPSGTSRPPGEFDDISNPIARERYARSFLDEKLRGMIAEREGSKAGQDFARREMDLRTELGRGQLALGRGGLEEQIRAEMAGEGLQRDRLGMETQFGADRRLGMEREYGLGMRGADLAERSLEEQIRANVAGEGLRGREVGVMEETGGYKDPLKRAEAENANRQLRQMGYADAWTWATSPGPLRRLTALLKNKDINGAVQFIRENNPDATPQDIKRVLSDLILDRSTKGELVEPDPWYAPPRWGIPNPENESVERQLMELLSRGAGG